MRLYHEREIAAAPQDVWDVLVDVRAWGDWNPTLTAANGPLVVGTTVRMRLRMGPVTVPMRQQIRAVDPPHHLAWRSINGVPGFMDVDREFLLDEVEGGTRLIQREAASGPGTPLLMPLLRDRILAGYEELADALADHVEHSSGQHRPAHHRSRRHDTTGPLMSDEHEAGPASGPGHDERPEKYKAAEWRQAINQHETFDHDSIDSLFYDWDRIGNPDLEPRAPLKFYVPQDTDDVVTAVKEAKQLGQRLIVRSKGHSSNDLVTPVGGAVLLTEKLHGVLEVDTDAMTATAWSGTPSAALDDVLAERGLGLPVIGDHAHITIGGFTSVGGITASSFKYGLFVDIVEELEYVDWDGEVHQLRRSEDLDEMHRVMLGLGRHGVITKITVQILRIRKYEQYWENHAERFETMDDFIDHSRDLCANPPQDATFLRGLWVDFPLGEERNLELGTFSVYREVEPSFAEKAIDAASHGVLHRLGAIAGRLPEKVDKLVKMAGLAGIVFAPRYATVKNAEYFTEKTVDSTVGDPQRFLVVISPIDSYEDHFRKLWAMLERYRDETGCFTFLSLYVKSIWSEYLSGGDPDNRRWLEFLFYVGVDQDNMTDELLDQIADELDEFCIQEGAFRYMHTRTGRDPERMAQFDANAMYNDGVSVHPYDRPLEA